MASLMTAFTLSLLLMWEMACGQELPSADHQERAFKSAHVGENLTIQCFYNNKIPGYVYWYKQILGQRPKLLLAFRTDGMNSFHEKTNNQSRFQIHEESGKALLKITDLQISDSAIYHCIYNSYLRQSFAESVMVSVKGFGSNFDALLHQPASEIIRSQGAVTLSCTVNTGSCDEEHRVYWYKSSKESPPVLIYTHGGTSGQCDAQSHTCFYQLPTDGLTESDAETYYCAVASCGRLLFGNGTKIRDDRGVYLGQGAIVFTTVTLSAFLAFSICMVIRMKSCKYSDVGPGLVCPSKDDVKGNGRAYGLYFATWSVSSRRKMDPTWSACVYSTVKQSNS